MKVRLPVLSVASLLSSLWILNSPTYAATPTCQTSQQSFYETVCKPSSPYSRSARTDRMRTFFAQNGAQADERLNYLERNIAPFSAETVRTLIKRAVMRNAVPGLFTQSRINEVLASIDQIEVLTAQNIHITIENKQMERRAEMYFGICGDTKASNAYFLSEWSTGTPSHTIAVCPGALTHAIGSGNREVSNLQNLIFYYGHEFGHHLASFANHSELFANTRVPVAQRGEVIADTWAMAAAHEYLIDTAPLHRWRALGEILSPLCGSGGNLTYPEGRQRFKLAFDILPALQDQVNCRENEHISAITIPTTD